MFTLIALMLCAIASYAQDEEQKTVNITANFTYCWNSAAESVASSEDGSLTYSSAAWGGLAAWVQGTDYGDLSIYSKIVFEFSEPTTVNTQILVQLADESNVSAWGNVGITELACEFGENDMSAVNQIALQTSEAVTLNVKRVYLVVRSGDEPGPVDPVDPVDPTVDQTKDLMPDFKGVWNEAETVTDKEDGTKEYVAAEWGGMNAWYGTADWSEWDALVVEFAEATPCATKLAILPGELAANAEAGVTSIKLEFGDADVSAIEQAALQAAEACTLNITKIYLIKYGKPAETLSFDAERSLLRFYASAGENEEMVQTDYAVTFAEMSLEPTKIENPVDALVFRDFTTIVTGGEAALVELQGWCYPADREKTDDDMMRFPLTQNSDGTWIYDFTNMDVIPMLQSDSHHDWVLEFCVNGNDDNGNTFTLNNGGENYKILFSDNLASSVKKGDVNEDKKVDISDIVAVINQIAGTSEYVGADVNEDKKVDISDIVAIINIIAGM